MEGFHSLDDVDPSAPRKNRVKIFDSGRGRISSGLPRRWPPIPFCTRKRLRPVRALLGTSDHTRIPRIGHPLEPARRAGPLPYHLRRPINTALVVPFDVVPESGMYSFPDQRPLVGYQETLVGGGAWWGVP